MNKRATCKQGHAMEAPNLITKTVKGREVRECRTCANARFKLMRKTKKDKLEAIVTEANEQQPAQNIKAIPIADWGGKDEDNPSGAQDCAAAEVDPMDFLEEPVSRVQTFGVTALADNGSGRTSIAGDHPAADDVADAYEDLPVAVEAIPESIAEGLRTGELILDTAFRQRPDGTVEAVEVSILPAQVQPTREQREEFQRLQVAGRDFATRVDAGAVAPLIESLHAPHGTPVAIPAPKPVKKRVGCEHGFPNPFLCPTCRANRPR